MVDRRDILRAAAAAMSVGGLTEVAGAQENRAAAGVVDRASAIRLTKLTPTIVGRKVFLKLETNMGVVGWGEVDQLEMRTAAALAVSLFSLLEGENPTRIEHLWQKVFRSHRDMRGGPFMVHTLSGFDMALWDIAGKLHGVPVYRLLGGPVRERVRCYPSATATKVGAGPMEYAGTPVEIGRLVQTVADARKQVGPGGMVMFDAHCALPPPFLLQFAAAVRPYELTYIEEPAVPGNLEVFKRLKEHVKVPFAVGEQARTIWEVIPYLQAGVCDFVQVDCAHTGGITQLVKIATLGEAYQAPLAPHCVTTDLGMTASLHVSAAVPMFLIHEYYPSITPKGLIRKSWSVDAEGYASLPQGPGLGCEVDEGVLAELAKKGVGPEWPVRGRLRDGSVADY